MRTTLTIDDGLLRQKALDTGQALQAGGERHPACRPGAAGGSGPAPLCLPHLSIGQPRWPVNLDKALALAAELEDQEIVAKLYQGR
ncbi:MAG: antitoxin [Cyanobacteriota bacterium]|nr:antitoxin [Cyanobacteriota bacterium]